MFREYIATFKDTWRLAKVVTVDQLSWVLLTTIGKEIVKQKLGTINHQSYAKTD